MGTKHQGSDVERTALDTYIKLLRATETLQSQANAQIIAHGLTMSQFAAMEALYHLGPMCLKEIGQKILKSGGNMTLVVDNLEKASFVERKRSQQDRRQIEVHLTDAGKDKITQVFPDHAAHLTRLLSVLNSEEQQMLGRLTRKLGLGISALNHS